MECPLQQDTNISIQTILWPHNMQLHNSWLSNCITAIWQNCTVKLFVTGWYLTYHCSDHIVSLIARFLGTTWGPAGADRTQVGPMLAQWTLLSGIILQYTCDDHTFLYGSDHFKHSNIVHGPVYFTTSLHTNTEFLTQQPYGHTAQWN